MTWGAEVECNGGNRKHPTEGVCDILVSGVVVLFDSSRDLRGKSVTGAVSLGEFIFDPFCFFYSSNELRNFHTHTPDVYVTI